MAGQHDLHNHQVAIKFPHELWRKIEIEAAKADMNNSEYIRSVVKDRVESTTLSQEDAQIVSNRIREAIMKGKMV